MDEHPIAGEPAGPVTPEQLASAAQVGKQASKRVTPNHLVAQVGSQMSALQQAETIKQLQSKVNALESQSKESGKVFLATITGLMTSAFALVAALAWNEAIQNLFKRLYPPPNNQEQVAWDLVTGSFIYAVVVTIIVVAIVFYLTKLNTKLGVRSLLAAGGGEVKKE